MNKLSRIMNSVSSFLGLSLVGVSLTSASINIQFEGYTPQYDVTGLIDLSAVPETFPPTSGFLLSNNGITFSETSSNWSFGLGGLSAGNGSFRMTATDPTKLFNLDAVSVSRRSGLDALGTFTVTTSNGGFADISTIGSYDLSANFDFKELSYADFTINKGAFFADNTTVSNVNAGIVNQIGNVYWDGFGSYIEQGFAFSNESGANWRQNFGDLSAGNGDLRISKEDGSAFDFLGLSVTRRSSLDALGTFTLTTSRGHAVDISAVDDYSFTGSEFQGVDYIDLKIDKNEFFADNTAIENIMLSNVANVPEPSSMLLVGLGCSVCCFTRNRK